MRVGLFKLWRCCQENRVATIIMQADDGQAVAYPACSPCAYSYTRHNRHHAGELYGVGNA